MANAIAPSKSIFDQSYQSSSAEKYHLSLQISDYFVLLALVEISQNKIVAFEEYNFESKNSASQQENFWKRIFDKDFFKLPFKTVSTYFVGRQCTLVPIDLYDETEEINFLKLNFRLEAHSTTTSDRIDALGAYTVFAYPTFLKTILKGCFVNYRLRHYSTPLIHQCLSSEKHNNETVVYLNVLKEHFELIVTTKEKLIFYNSFPFSNAEDFLYYMLYALEKLQVDSENSLTYLSGKVGKNTEIYRLLFMYIKNLKFLNKPKGINYSILLNDLTDPYYYTLFSQYICE